MMIASLPVDRNEWWSFWIIIISQYNIADDEIDTIKSA